MRPVSGGLGVSLTTAFQMLAARSVRTAVATAQFTVGFAALVVLVAGILTCHAVTAALSSTFQPTSVIGLYPVLSGGTGHEVFISPDDFAALSDLRGVAKAAVVWYGTATLSDGRQIRTVAVNEAAEDIIGLRVVEAWKDAPSRVSQSGRNAVFLTRQAIEMLGGAGLKAPSRGALEFALLGRTFSANVHGIVAPRRGWPPRPLPGGLASIEIDLPAIVLGYEAVRDIARLENAIWLELEPGIEVQEATEALASWHLRSHPESNLKLGVVSIEDEIARQAATRRPETWVAGTLATILLLLSSLGFAGQTMMMSEARRPEWALRMALGATRLHLAVQLAIETLAVIALAALLGLILGIAAVSLMFETRAASLTPWVGPAALAVLGASLALSGISAVIPILRVSREEASAVMKESY